MNVPQQAQSALAAARQMHQAGRLAEAEKLYRHYLQFQPNHASTLYNLATVLRSLNRPVDAIPFLQRALAIRPKQPEIYNDLCFAHQVAGQIDEAITVARQAIVNLPDSPLGYFHLGQTYVGLLKPAEAIRTVMTGLERCGQDPDLVKILADAYSNVGRFREAAEQYRKLIEIRPNLAGELECDLGNCLRNLGELDQALAAYDRAEKAAVPNPRAVAGRIETLESLRRRADAEQLAHDAMSPGRPLHPDLVIACGRVCLRTKQQQKAIDLAKRLLADPSVPMTQQHRSQVMMMLGSLYEDIEQYDDAFASYREGNDLYGNVIDEQKFAESVDGLLEAFSAANIVQYARSSCDSELPVFIVGMPRSGTSLLEQILASHPAVYGGGERREIHEISLAIARECGSESLPYPACLARATTELMDRLAATHLATLSDMAPEAARFTDKNPPNYFHVGLLSLLFPKARIIHSLRNPLDTCWSCYATRLGPGHLYANDLRSLGLAYRAYRRIMNHWHTVLTTPILDIEYEQVVSNPEPTVRKLLEFCGLEFHPDCLKFHESKRLTKTASIDQVVKPVYTTSVGRYRHFEEYLGELKELVAEYL